MKIVHSSLNASFVTIRYVGNVTQKGMIVIGVDVTDQYVLDVQKTNPTIKTLGKEIKL